MLGTVFPPPLRCSTEDFVTRLAGGKVASKDFKETIDFTLIAGLICIRARLNDQEEEDRFILDTYSVCLVQESLWNIPGLDILDATSPLGPYGGVVFEDIGAMAMRKSPENVIQSVLEDGLIGANLMKLCVWRIDFRDQKIILTDRADSFPDLEKAVKIPFIPKPILSSPDVQVLLGGGEKVTVQFDTGSTGFLSLLTPSLKTLVESGKVVAWRAKLDTFMGEASDQAIETHRRPQPQEQYPNIRLHLRIQG